MSACGGCLKYANPQTTSKARSHMGQQNHLTRSLRKHNQQCFATNIGSVTGKNRSIGYSDLQLGLTFPKIYVLGVM